MPSGFSSMEEFTNVFKRVLPNKKTEEIFLNIRKVTPKLEGEKVDEEEAKSTSGSRKITMVIDDSKMHTLAYASTMHKPVSEELDYSCKLTIGRNDEILHFYDEAGIEASQDGQESRAVQGKSGRAGARPRYNEHYRAQLKSTNRSPGPCERRAYDD
ncbi:hypothetical protein QJS10_CPB13g01628 [Acorus calamus]|uniref:Uncharacterized protein n=1 Tax=Acorus calamus TaxID=4465 RepID=A0AAV9DLA0_ACOCL|nr:hypothetical protein QJS10_CPB13g01628 [Acorus calamus]